MILPPMAPQGQGAVFGRCTFCGLTKRYPAASPSSPRWGRPVRWQALQAPSAPRRGSTRVVGALQGHAHVPGGGKRAPACRSWRASWRTPSGSRSGSWATSRPWGSWKPSGQLRTGTVCCWQACPPGPDPAGGRLLLLMGGGRPSRRKP
ncbi:hypothetical protein QJS66_08925 [Kocuria rhizophila]|nr:hypothetical protein QJS66_08925 [Kocuria rhizophila]